MTMTRTLAPMRRDQFLKTVGAVGLATTGLPALAQVAGLTALAPETAEAAAASRTITSASHFGMLQADVQGSIIQRLRPHPLDPHPTPMLAGMRDLVYTPSRVRYPMVRQSYLKNGYRSDTSGRGNEAFVRVSWDAAIDLVAGELRRVKTTYGNQAIYAGSYGWESTGTFHDAAGMLHRMLNGYGGYVDEIGDYSAMAGQRILPHVIGTLGVYDQQTVWPVVLAHTKLMVFWGSDPVQNSQIEGSAPDHYVYPVLPKLKAAGIRVISINPFNTDTNAALGGEWQPIRPCTDLPVMLALAYTLVNEKLVDRSFLSTYTVGYDKFEPYLLGKTDGVPKTPQWAESISHVPAAWIAQLARDMAHTRTMIVAGWGIQRQDHGEQQHWMLVALASMLGQIGLPGGGFGFAYHYGGAGAPTSKGPALSGLPPLTVAKTGERAPKWVGKGSKAIPVTRWVDQLLHPGKTIDFDGEKITYNDIKMIFWAGGNPIVHHQNTNELMPAWRKPQTIVVNEISWTPTAKHADIVLPATSNLERNDMAAIGDYSNRGLIAMQQAVPPIFEARSDFAIYGAIAERLGFGQEFTGGKSEMEWLQTIYATARKQGAASGVTMPAFATFWKQGVLLYPFDPKAEQYVTYAAFRADPASNPLSTPSGLIEIYSNTIASFHYDDCPPHPTWMEPVEWLGGAVAKTYPLALTTPHPKYRLHSQLDNTAMEQHYNKPGGRAPLWMNPHDAAARGLKTDDTARVFNGRGELLATVEVTDRLMQGVARMEEGTWYDPQHPGQLGSMDKEGCPNVLTTSKATSKLAQGDIVNSLQVQIAKYTGPALPITAYTAPRSI